MTFDANRRTTYPPQLEPLALAPSVLPAEDFEYLCRLLLDEAAVANRGGGKDGGEVALGAFFDHVEAAAFRRVGMPIVWTLQP